MKNKVIARHSWDISTYRTKTHQELKPLKAEVSTSFCSPCILQLLFKHTLCLHTLTELPSVPAQSSTIQTSTYCTVAEIFFCFSTKLVLPISDTPYLHRFTRLYTIMRKTAFIMIFLNCLWKNVYTVSHSMRKVCVFPICLWRKVATFCTEIIILHEFERLV